MCFLNSDERDDFLSVLKRNVQDLDVVESADEQIKQAKTWSKIAHCFFGANAMGSGYYESVSFETQASFFRFTQ